MAVAAPAQPVSSPSSDTCRVAIMKKSQLAAVGVILLGMAMLTVATLLPMLLPTSTFWTDEQAQEQATASSRLHQVTHRTAHMQESKTASAADKLQAQQELEAAKARYDASRAALDRAQFWNRRLPSILRWTGSGVALLGVLAYVSATSMQD
jgi:hypothetical protein